MKRLGWGVVVACLTACGQASEPVAGNPMPSWSRDRLADAERRYWKAEYPAAATGFREVLGDAELAADSVVQARALTWLSLTAYRQSAYHDAEELGRRSLELSRRLDDAVETFRAANALGLIALDQGRLAGADSLFGLAITAARRARDADGMARATGNQALVQVDQGNYAGARAGFTMLLEAGIAQGELRLEGNALVNLAMLDRKEGDPAAARTRLGRARTRYATLGYRLGEIGALGQLSTVLLESGDLPAAVAAADSALGLARAGGLAREESASLEVLSEAMLELGQPRPALRLLDSAQRINASLGLRIEQGGNARRRAVVLSTLGQTGAAAVALGREAARIHEEAGAHADRIADYLVMAGLEPGGADGWIARARQLADSLGATFARFDVAMAEARRGLDRRSLRPARRALETAAALIAPGDLIAEWQHAELAAEFAAASLTAAEAIPAAARALASQEQIPRGVRSEVARAKVFQSAPEARARLVDLLTQTGRLAEAFVVADGSGSSDRLDEPVSGRLDEAAAGAHLYRIRALADRLREAESNGDGGVEELYRRLRDERDQYERAAVAAGGDSVRGRPMVSGTAAAGLVDRIQTALRPGERILEYFPGIDAIHLFAVSRSGIEHRLIRHRPIDFGRRVRLAVDLTARPGHEADAAPVLTWLFDQLIAPVSGGRGPAGQAERLVIVAHGALAHLPFAALLDPVSGEYLVQRADLITPPSAAAFAALRLRAVAASRPGSAVVLAPYPRSLPWSGAEAVQVAKAFDRVEQLTGAAATKANLSAAMNRVEVIHVATHASLNADNPLFSRIDLAPGDDGDGRLEVHEIDGLRTSARLVFLSGCETARRVPMRSGADPGEDLATLALAFHRAGAANVVATLWRVSDRGAGLVAEGFYRALGTHDVGQSLAGAQRAVLAVPGLSDPYYWAGFVAIGGGI